MTLPRLPVVSTVRRLRLLSGLAPAAALAAALTYGLHHTPPLQAHGLETVMLAIVVAAAVSALLALATPAADRRLPVIVTVDPGGGSVRALDRGDLDFGAALQRETLGHGFFPLLGHRFLRAYLATFVDSPHGVALLVTARDAPLGMVVGVLRPRSHARWVLRHRAGGLAARGAGALFLRPVLAVRFVRTRLASYGRAWRRVRGPARSGPEAQSAVLSHVAVAPGAQGSGLGAQLVAAYLDAARAAGCERVVLTTLVGPSGAGGFYRRHGWREEGERRTLDGRRTLEFSIDPASRAE